MREIRQQVYFLKRIVKKSSAGAQGERRSGALSGSTRLLGEVIETALKVCSLSARSLSLLLDELLHFAAELGQINVSRIGDRNAVP
jgi:hypothetical protein